MDEQTRKAWSRPELIEIVRGRPEEAVLTACKNQPGGAGPGAANGGCWTSCAAGTCEVTEGS
jgi:hypothetical protein